ncbi:GUN4 domain-containing protein [Aerosakkonema sp. BLCC-F183]|uniref:GUN4 domain-containing protein n=1 Tax=Aerosakkonema sp. BLCC-F183 TaxID=3342834 RepID=UPI0035B91B52
MQGKTLGGRYQIISHLGGGGFGTTFLAVDRHLPGNPQCVVKQLKPKTADNPSALQVARRLFNREAEVLYQLGNHDRIPRLFAHFEEEQEFYLVQEFVAGYELKQELSAGQQLNEAQVIVLLRDILEILGFVHQQNVIHRDIKPSNLIRRRLDGKLVLIDFGAVKQFGSQVINPEGETSLTIAVGSPGYMPNEQMAGKPRFSSDIFAVGIIGIQAATGLNPRQLPEDPRTCEIVWRNFVQVSSEFADVLDKMVRYDFRQRYQSADEALSALNSVPTTALTAKIAVPLTDVSSDINSLPTETIAPDDLSSECGIDYSRLRNLLATREWQEADEETRALMLKVFRKDTKDWLSKEVMEKFPCVDIRTIDRLWVKYSKGHFGFSVQQRIWQSIGGKPDADYTTYCHFVDRIGWRVEQNWLSWFDLTFSLKAPEGHLPVGLGRGMVGFGLAFLSRVEACGLDEQTDLLSNIKLEKPTDDLSSERGVDYTKLQNLLASGKWKEATDETKAVILQAVGREQEDRLIVEDLEKFPCSDLRTIDNLWVKYSNGRFGFSVQRRIWENIGGKKDATRDADYQTWRNFGEQVGWRLNDSWLLLDELNFTLNATVGHLPTLPNRRWWGLSYHLISRRIEACQLEDPSDVSSNIKAKISTDDLSCKRGVDYTHLRDLLAAGKWQEADRETMALMQMAAGKEEEEKLTVEEIEKLPCSDLRAIDNLWVKYSKGRFGFSVQQRIWQSIGGTLDAPKDADYDTWHRFGEQVGWRVKGSWLMWDKLTFSSNASVGHLPALSMGRWSRSWWGLNYHIVSRRIEACKSSDRTEVLSVKQESKLGVDYTYLRELLAAGKWKEADLETKAVILQASGRNKEASLQLKDIKKIGCSDIRMINQLWLEFSNGRFGFSVQKQIFLSLNGSWPDFGDRVGWVANGAWLRYDRLNFSLDAPSGHLPLLGIDLMDSNIRILGSAIIAKLTECNIQ